MDLCWLCQLPAVFRAQSVNKTAQQPFLLSRLKRNLDGASMCQALKPWVDQSPYAQSSKWSLRAEVLALRTLTWPCSPVEPIRRCISEKEFSLFLTETFPQSHHSSRLHKSLQFKIIPKNNKASCHVTQQGRMPKAPLGLRFAIKAEHKTKP